MQVHHIGYAVVNIEKAEKIFEKLGYTKMYSMKKRDVDRNVNVQLMNFKEAEICGGGRLDIE